MKFRRTCLTYKGGCVVELRACVLSVGVPVSLYAWSGGLNTPPLAFTFT
jgi:hypothetical protein